VALSALALVSACGSVTRGVESFRQEAVARALRTALPAFARAPVPADAWPRQERAFSGVRASREIARLVGAPGGPLALYLVATRKSGTCLELAGVSGDCNDAPNFFGASHFQLLETADVVAGVVDPAVASLRMRTRRGVWRPIVVTPDHGILVRCPAIGGAGCRGDVLLGLDHRSRPLFTVTL
jgi:hypothetical protein